MNALEKNIRKTIREMKRNGTIAASLASLRQNTPVSGVTLVIERRKTGQNLAETYREVFDETAARVAADMDFGLCRD